MRQAENQALQRAWAAREREWTRKAARGAMKEPVLLLSAGHGFGDPGALAPILTDTEADINLHLAWTTIAQWSDNYDNPPGRIIPLEAPTLAGVIKQANKHHRVLRELGVPVWALELHCNASTNPEARGAEVIHYPNNLLSKELGTLVLKHTTGPSWPNRGLKTPKAVGHSKLGFIEDTTMAALIFEVGFITNLEDRTALVGGGLYGKATQLAQGIYEAQLYIQAWYEDNHRLDSGR